MLEFVLFGFVPYAAVAAAWGFTAEYVHNRRNGPRLMLEAILWPVVAAARLLVLLTRV
jgi:hypothetical protein